MKLTMSIQEKIEIVLVFTLYFSLVAFVFYQLQQNDILFRLNDGFKYYGYLIGLNAFPGNFDISIPKMVYWNLFVVVKDPIATFHLFTTMFYYLSLIPMYLIIKEISKSKFRILGLIFFALSHQGLELIVGYLKACFAFPFFLSSVYFALKFWKTWKWKRIDFDYLKKIKLKWLYLIAIANIVIFLSNLSMFFISSMFLASYFIFNFLYRIIKKDIVKGFVTTISPFILMLVLVSPIYLQIADKIPLYNKIYNALVDEGNHSIEMKIFDKQHMRILGVNLFFLNLISKNYYYLNFLYLTNLGFIILGFYRLFKQKIEDFSLIFIGFLLSWILTQPSIMESDWAYRFLIILFFVYAICVSKSFEIIEEIDYNKKIGENLLLILMLGIMMMAYVLYTGLFFQLITTTKPSITFDEINCLKTYLKENDEKIGFPLLIFSGKIKYFFDDDNKFVYDGRNPMYWNVSKYIMDMNNSIFVFYETDEDFTNENRFKYMDKNITENLKEFRRKHNLTCNNTPKAIKTCGRFSIITKKELYCID